MPRANWNELPADLLLKIATCVAGTAGMRGACRSWRTGLEAVATKLKIKGSNLPLSIDLRFSSLTTLDLQDCSLVTAEGLWALQNLRSLTSLSLKMDTEDFNEPFLGGLRGISSLTELDLDLTSIEDPDFTDERLKMLHGLPVIPIRLDFTGLENPPSRALLLGLPALRSLTLHECWTDDLEALKGLQLETLKIGESCSLSDEAMGSLRGMPLTSLDFGIGNFEGSELSDVGMEALRGLPLTNLNLGSKHWVTDAGLDALRGMPLTRLDTGSSERVFGVLPMPGGFTDAGLVALGGMPLTDLIFSESSGITGVEFQALRGAPLKFLYLSDCGMTDAGLQFLRGFQLERLDLTRNGEVTDTGLEALRGMPLKSLNLSGTEVSDDGLDVLKGMPLNSLDLSDTEVSDAGLEALKGLPLKSLGLSYTGITGEGLQALKGLPLTEVCVQNCEDLDHSELAKFWEGRFKESQVEKKELESRLELLESRLKIVETLIL